MIMHEYVASVCCLVRCTLALLMLIPGIPGGPSLRRGGVAVRTYDLDDVREDASGSYGRARPRALHD